MLRSFIATALLSLFYRFVAKQPVAEMVIAQTGDCLRIFARTNQRKHDYTVRGNSLAVPGLPVVSFSPRAV